MYNTEISTEYCSADVENVERQKVNDCRLKKWYREWQRTSDKHRTVRRMVEELVTFELAMSRLYRKTFAHSAMVK